MPEESVPRFGSSTQSLRRPRFRTLREDYVAICEGNTVAALILDYFASIERLHEEARQQGDILTEWRSISGKYGGTVTMLSPAPSHETVRKALLILIRVGVIEAHPDNGKPAAANTTSSPNRYRLHAIRLLALEHQWATSALITPPHDDAGGLTQTRRGGIVTTRHESVSIDRERGDEETPSPNPTGQGDPMLDESLPDHLTPSQRNIALRNDTVANMTGWQLVEAFVRVGRPEDQVSAAAQAMWSDWKVRRDAAQLAKMGTTPEDVTALVLQKLQLGGGYAFRFMITDMVEWKASPQAQPVKPREYFEATDDAPRLTPEQIAEMKAMRNKRHDR